jgi:hypothetical protein
MAAIFVYFLGLWLIGIITNTVKKNIIKDICLQIYKIYYDRKSCHW